MFFRRMSPAAVGFSVLVGAVVVDVGTLPTEADAVTAKPAPTAVEIERRADALLAQMTLREQIDHLGGGDNVYIRAVKRLGLPPFRMADGRFGVRNVGPSTAY